MAAYSGTPTVVRFWYVGDRNGKQVEISKDLTITLSSQGGLTNTVGDTALGFASINTVQTIQFVDGSSVIRAVALTTDGTNVYTCDPQVSTDADRGKAADVTGTLTFRITGYV